MRIMGRQDRWVPIDATDEASLMSASKSNTSVSRFLNPKNSAEACECGGLIHCWRICNGYVAKV